MKIYGKEIIDINEIGLCRGFIMESARPCHLASHPDDLKYFDEFFLTEKKQTEAFLGFKRYYQGMSGSNYHLHRKVPEKIKHFR
jgi:hypothetical protein